MCFGTRKHLGQDGLIVVVATIDSSDGHVISGPDIVSRGFVYVRESEPLMDDIKRQIVSVFESCADHKVHEWGVIKNKVKDDLGKLLYDRTRPNPDDFADHYGGLSRGKGNMPPAWL